MSIGLQRSASIQKRTSPLKFDIFRWKIPNFTVSNLSTESYLSHLLLLLSRQIRLRLPRLGLLQPGEILLLPRFRHLGRALAHVRMVAGAIQRTPETRVERYGSRATVSFESLHIRIPLKFCQNSAKLSQFFRNSDKF